MDLNFFVGFASDMEQMKERFAKLLLGEDMSGGGKGVSSALALSNAITNLAGILISCPLYIILILFMICKDSICRRNNIKNKTDYTICSML